MVRCWSCVRWEKRDFGVYECVATGKYLTRADMNADEGCGNYKKKEGI